MKNNESNDRTDEMRVAEAIEEMRAEAGRRFSLATVNLAELERRTGISRAKLRRMKQNGFKALTHANKGRKSEHTILTGYSGMLDTMLSCGVANSSVCFERLREAGYCGGLTAVKNYIIQHRNLIPAPRHLVAPLGNRVCRYTTEHENRSLKRRRKPLHRFSRRRR